MLHLLKNTTKKPSLVIYTRNGDFKTSRSPKYDNDNDNTKNRK